MTLSQMRVVVDNADLLKKLQSCLGDDQHIYISTDGVALYRKDEQKEGKPILLSDKHLENALSQVIGYDPSAANDQRQNKTSVESQKGRDKEDKEMVFVNTLCALIREHISDADYDYQCLANDMNLSARALQKKIKMITGLTANGFIQSVRLEAAAEILRQDAQSVKCVAYDVGFKDPRYFTRLFKKYFGVIPSKYAYL